MANRTPTPTPEELLEQAEEVRDMTESKGWKIVESWINQRIRTGIDDLMTCPVKEVEVRRAKVQAMREILLKIREFLTADGLG